MVEFKYACTAGQWYMVNLLNNAMCTFMAVTILSLILVAVAAIIMWESYFSENKKHHLFAKRTLMVVIPISIVFGTAAFFIPPVEIATAAICEQVAKDK